MFALKNKGKTLYLETDIYYGGCGLTLPLYVGLERYINYNKL